MAAWITPLADGRYAILQPQPQLDGWFRQIGPAFINVAHAKAYAKQRGLVVVVPDVVEGARRCEAKPASPPARKAPSYRGLRVEELAERIRADLDDLYRQHPHGILSATLMERYGFDLKFVNLAILRLHELGLVSWEHEGHMGNTKVLRPRRNRSLALTPGQEEVLHLLRANADENGLARVSVNQLRIRTNRSGFVTYIRIEALIEKGLIEAVAPNVYRILHKGAGPVLTSQDASS